MTDANKGRWPEIILIYCLGVFAMMVISEAAPALGGIAREFRPPDRSIIGWVMSLPALMAALFALAAGWVVDRVGDRRVLLLSGLVLIAGDIGVVTAPSISAILPWRIVGGLGYVFMAVAGVTMMARRTEGRRRVAALALWSTAIPASFIVAFLAAPALAPYGGWRAIFVAHSVATVALLLVGALVLPRKTADEVTVSRTSGIAQVLRSPWAYVLGLSFAANAFFQTGMIAALPALLSMKSGMTENEIHGLSSIAMMLNIAGALVVGALLSRGTPAWRVGVGGALLCAVAGAVLVLAPLNPIRAAIADCALMFGLGTLMGLWALLPQVAPSPRSIGATSGLITQLTLVGVLFGPPAALAGQAMGQSGLLAFVAGAVLAGLIGAPVWLRRSNSTAGTPPVGH